MVTLTCPKCEHELRKASQQEAEAKLCLSLRQRRELEAGDIGPVWVCDGCGRIMGVLS